MYIHDLKIYLILIGKRTNFVQNEGFVPNGISNNSIKFVLNLF